MSKILSISIIVVTVITVGLLGLAGWTLYPHNKQLFLPPPLLAITSPQGRARIKDANGLADYDSLMASFESQLLVSYCGVASSVTVLNALGNAVNQYDFFTEDTSNVSTQLTVMLGGMSLEELAGMLNAYDLQASVTHMEGISLDEFRSTVEKNLTTKHDYLIVNYQRSLLGQGKIGHISPLGAYDSDTDSVLILDTASHKYPHTWVPLELLYAGMKTIDSSSGKMRGYVDVSN